MLEDTKAFLAIWHDLIPDGTTEWERWHTYEHMPERVGIPGFLGGRRYMNHDDPHQCCFTMYEGSELSIFKSAAYLERLNNPTPWTQANAPTFRNFTRGACRCVSSSGPERGYGGSVMTIRLQRDATFSEDTERFNQLTKSASELDGVLAVTLGLCDSEITATETAERKLRKGTDETSLDGVLILEGYDAATLEARGEDIHKLVLSANINLTPHPHQIFDFSYMLRQ